MNNCRCVEYSPCKMVSLILSAILGIAAGILFFNGLVVLTPFVSGFLLISATAFLFLLFAGALAVGCCMNDETKECFCKNIGFIITGIAGSIALSLFAIAFGTLAGTLGAVIIALIVFFFALIISGIICFLLCVCPGGCGNNSAGTNNNCYCCTCCCCDNSQNNSCDCKC